MKNENAAIYTPFKIGGLTVQNRLVRSATFEFAGEDGRITPQIVELYRALAAGGSGLLISGMQAVLPGARSNPVMVETTYEQYTDDMKQLVDVVHEAGSLLFVQLNHGGNKTAKLPGYDRIAVSEMEIGGETYHAATAEEIQQIVEGFAAAAKRVQEAGCDGVQIHAGHSYLLNTFLSPYFNHRTDDYGGPVENRARILFQIYGAIRAAVGKDYPVSVKLPYDDRVLPSITSADCLYICKELERQGIDMIEITAGIDTNGASAFAPAVQEEGTFLDGAAQVAAAVQIPVVSVCGYRTPDFIEQTLSETALAAVSLCRPLIWEPDLPNRWKTDRSKARCISCNQCFKSKGIIACQVKDKKASGG